MTARRARWSSPPCPDDTAIPTFCSFPFRATVRSTVTDPRPVPRGRAASIRLRIFPPHAAMSVCRAPWVRLAVYAGPCVPRSAVAPLPAAVVAARGACETVGLGLLGWVAGRACGRIFGGTSTCGEWGGGRECVASCGNATSRRGMTGAKRGGAVVAGGSSASVDVAAVAA